MTQLTTKLSAIAGFALLSVAPAVGLACEYDASTSASATPPAQLASAPTPEASRMPTSMTSSSNALKGVAPKKTTKQVVDKTNETSRSDVKTVALTAN